MKTIAMTRLLTLGMMAFLLTSCTQEQQNKISRDIQNWTGTNGVLEVYAGDKVVRRFLKIDKISTALGTDDGKPPVIAGLIESAMTNPDRPLASVLRSFATVEPDKRAVLTDQVRAFLGRAFEGALADARLRYVDVMRSRPEFKWPHDPWAAVLPSNNAPSRARAPMPRGTMLIFLTPSAEGSSVATSACPHS